MIFKVPCNSNDVILCEESVYEFCTVSGLQSHCLSVLQFLLDISAQQKWPLMAQTEEPELPWEDSRHTRSWKVIEVERESGENRGENSYTWAGRPI